MKKFIRDMIDDLQRKKDKDFVPNVPACATAGKMTQLEPKPEPAQPDDLENQVLSNDPLERVRQLDFQAQQDEEREAS